MTQRRIIIIGASSGIGHRIATDFARQGMHVGIAARRAERLHDLQRQFPDRITASVIDVTSHTASSRFMELIDKMGGMDILLLASGRGMMNPGLDSEPDLDTINVNVAGFIRIVNAAYRYFRDSAHQRTFPGQIAVITSVAGTKGIGIAASYSASKRFGSTYIDALEQLAHQENANIRFTDIRPGFIRTDFLAGTQTFPMEMSLDHAATLIERAIIRHKRVAVIDSRWRILTALWRMLPPWIWLRCPLNVKQKLKSNP